MTAPPHTLNPDHTAESDTSNDRSPAYLVSASSPTRNKVPRNSTSGNTARRTTSYDPDIGFAYEANPTSDTAFCSNAYATSSANSTHDADTTTGAPYSLAGMSTNAATVPNPNLASSGSLPWQNISVPYPNSASRPIYEPTGELMHEVVEAFEQFDDPSSFRQSHWISEQEAVAGKTQQATRVPTSAIRSLSAIRDIPNPPKPALKRSLESDGGDVYQEGNQQPQIDTRKLRRVSFEQMSGTGPASADDEDSSSSEGPSSTRPPAQGRPGGISRRGRGSRAANVPPARSTAQQGSATRPPGTSGRGSKTPTGHPPSILPRENVFPIQIGSELFRLSGASISSDAPSYFTQFFEEQIRHNEESGGVRTLYIDRDPETFRDVARHLQGYYVKPRDGSHFVKLFADAQFYSCQCPIQPASSRKPC